MARMTVFPAQICCPLNSLLTTHAQKPGNPCAKGKGEPGGDSGDSGKKHAFVRHGLDSVAEVGGGRRLRGTGRFFTLFKNDDDDGDDDFNSVNSTPDVGLELTILRSGFACSHN